MALIAESDGELPHAAAMVMALAITLIFTVIVGEIGTAMRDGFDRRKALKGLGRDTDVAINHCARAVPFQYDASAALVLTVRTLFGSVGIV